MKPISRRNVILTGAALAGAAVIGEQRILAQERTPPAAARRRTLRIAHLTDAHVQPERGAGDGLAACLRHAQSLADKPDVILQGGDAVMETNAVNFARAQAQGEVWKKVMKAECSLPVEHCIGNHDIWGVDRGRSKTSGNEPGWGKAWALDLYGLKERYRTFDRAGWRFIVLDSTFISERGYAARLDVTQFEWLRRTLAGTDKNMPVLVLSHIPIVSACAYFDGENEKSGDWTVPGSWMHIDARAITGLFAKYPNVKVCLSGHIHMVDRVDFRGVSYLCNGAVCGGWWKGAYNDFKEGYGIVDLFDDGTFESQYVAYGWKAREA